MEGILRADLHGKNRYQAKVTVDSLLRRADGSVYRIRIVHGCHGGTELRTLLQEYAAHPRVRRLALSPDGGTTDLILREF